MKVLNALKWLIEHNTEHECMITKEANLSWMNDKNKADLPNVLEMVTEHTDEEVDFEASREDVGPAGTQSVGHESSCLSVHPSLLLLAKKVKLHFDMQIHPFLQGWLCT